MNKSDVNKFFKALSYKDVVFEYDFIGNGMINVTGSRNLEDPITHEIQPLEATETFNYRNGDQMQLLLAIRDWIHQIEKHEADEWIVFNGKQPFQPHISKVTTL